MLFPLSRSNYAVLNVASQGKVNPLGFFKGTHGISSMCSITIASSSSTQIEICSVWRITELMDLLSFNVSRFFILVYREAGMIGLYDWSGGKTVDKRHYAWKCDEFSVYLWYFVVDRIWWDLHVCMHICPHSFLHSLDWTRWVHMLFGTWHRSTQFGIYRDETSQRIKHPPICLLQFQLWRWHRVLPVCYRLCIIRFCNMELNSWDWGPLFSVLSSFSFINLYQIILPFLRHPSQITSLIYGLGRKSVMWWMAASSFILYWKCSRVKELFWICKGRLFFFIIVEPYLLCA